MAQEWDWPPTRRRYYARADFDIDVTPKAPTKRSVDQMASTLVWTLVKIILAIPLVALLFAAVWFLCVLLSLPGHSETLDYPTLTESGGPSFNCSYAKTPDEVLICENVDLSNQDVYLVNFFYQLRNQAPARVRAQMDASEAAWLRQRHQCGRDAACINTMYNRRVRELGNQFCGNGTRYDCTM
jgi:hypothetical protein